MIVQCANDRSNGQKLEGDGLLFVTSTFNESEFSGLAAIVVFF